MEHQVLERPDSRGVSPMSQMGEPLLEVIQQPIYSSVAFNNALMPNEVRFFQFQVGDVVPGAGLGAVVSSFYHTNMEQAGVLAQPKVFEVQGIRLVLSNLNGAGTEVLQRHPAAPGAAVQADLLEDMQRLFWGTLFTFHVGTKDYLVAPSWLVPGNAGISGFHDVGHDDGAAPEVHVTTAIQGAGKYYSTQPYTPFIPPQQSFFASIRTPQATAPTIASATDLLLWCMLDGRLGREAQ